LSHESIRNRSKTGTQRKRIRREAQIVVFKLGCEDYGIEIGQVREIIRRREITPMPWQPPYVEGVINVRGTIIPVVNLNKRFGLEGDASTHPHTIIVESGDGLIGMLVDAVSEVIRVPPDQIHPVPSITTGVDSKYLRGICRLGERLLIFLDVKKVVKLTPTATSQNAKLQEMTIRPSMTAN
jgi:purine-binding chemotaxis protein CheW